MQRIVLTGALAAVAALGVAMPAYAGDWFQWSSHGLNRLWYEGRSDGANDVIVTAVPQGENGASSVTLTDRAETVFSQPPACVPLGVNSGRCLVATSGMTEPFTTLDLPLGDDFTGDDAPVRFESFDLPLALSALGGEGPDRFAVHGGRPATVAGYGGDDVFHVRNGHYDDVRCGAGDDTVIGDTADVLSDCEDVKLG